MCLSTLIRLLSVAMLLVLSWSTSVLATATVSVTTSGDSSYSVQGLGMDNVAGIQLEITYDAASLSTPKIAQGSLVAGAVFTANTSLPGRIKIAVISTNVFSGNGQIAIITFASKSAAAPLPTVTANMIDSKGSPLASSNNPATPIPAQGLILTPGVPFSQTSQQQSSSTATTSGAVSATTQTYLGSVTLPAEPQQRTDTQSVTSSTVPINIEEPTVTSTVEQTQPPGKSEANAKANETSQYVIYKGVLDRFRKYNGDKKFPAMTALFNKKVDQAITQEPAILLSDGQSKAILTVDIPVKISSSPNFAVVGGTLVSFKHDKQSKGRWTVEVLPDTGSMEVTVSIIAGSEEYVFPLTVAQPANTLLTLDESGWNRFVNEVGTVTAPLNDFNNDGVRDYLDEFIFIANHLVRKNANKIRKVSG